MREKKKCLCRFHKILLKGSTHGNYHFRGESFSMWSAARQSQWLEIGIPGVFNNNAVAKLLLNVNSTERELFFLHCFLRAQHFIFEKFHLTPSFRQDKHCAMDVLECFEHCYLTKHCFLPRSNATDASPKLADTFLLLFAVAALLLVCSSSRNLSLKKFCETFDSSGYFMVFFHLDINRGLRSGDFSSLYECFFFM
ncbi:hypothetical protein Y032_0119g866 [Ancylostoma ceylanicum]|uniref:Uncharacterized protein n=1 Tax=Ancylostoma ceylanicum TaxID=53326 RepID=A0A016TB97_9BILA|nr:hypothetical protein Y032_0119g866 [Ancylostoma ceylanicum]